jgi:hypothetical protein
MAFNPIAVLGQVTHADDPGGLKKEATDHIAGYRNPGTVGLEDA